MSLILNSGFTIGPGTVLDSGYTNPPPTPSPSPTFFPLSNTATDPTSADWRADNPGYTFTPFVGITTPAPMTNASRMFRDNADFNDHDVALWDVSNVTDMSNMFYVSGSFNQNLNSWNTGRVTNMSYMFNGASSFNQPLNSWDVSNVTNMGDMFRNASLFNQNLDNWNTGNVVNMSGMFSYAFAFNQPLNSWNVGNVTNMSAMFETAFVFNQDLNSWNTGKVTNMNQMFVNAQQFIGNISSWDTSNVISMDLMFFGAAQFNGDISSWNTSKVTSMPNMFFAAYAFNCGQAPGVPHDLMQRTASSGWQVGNVNDMTAMFSNATSFNGDISNWCVTTLTSIPNSFATGANASFTVARQPTWGACPYTNPPPTGLTSSDPSTSAWQIKQDYPASTDGLYWIQNANINSGTAVQIYADMTTLGGGWTLLVQNNYTDWAGSDGLLLNQTTPPSTLVDYSTSTNIANNYSILGWADYIKRSPSGFDYMFDAGVRRYNGAAYTANEAYSFVEVWNNQTVGNEGLQGHGGSIGWRKNITELYRFPAGATGDTATWDYSTDGIEARMPWYALGHDDQAILTTDGPGNSGWWGTIIATGGWGPAPWISTTINGSVSIPPNAPGVIWYWVR